MQPWSQHLCAFAVSCISLQPLLAVQAMDTKQTEPAAQTVLVMAQAPANNNGSALQQIASLLQQARLPGQSRLFQQAQLHFQQLAPEPSAEYWLISADLAQQQHQFDAALAALQQAELLQPQPQIALVRARIALVRAQPKQALTACKPLLAFKELFLFQLCSLEAIGRAGKVDQSYPLLLKLARQTDMPLPERLYLQATLAEQAEWLQQPTVATAHLLPWLSQAPVPFWIKWADLTLSLEPATVYQRLATLNKDAALEDSLLLRLARAEQLTNQGQQYQQLAAAQIQLRERRQDLLHSADLAYFYLHLQPNARKAQQYSGLNYQQAKEPDDQKLALQSGWTQAALDLLVTEEPSI
jgi:hypothetical protein